MKERESEPLQQGQGRSLIAGIKGKLPVTEAWVFEKLEGLQIEEDMVLWALLEPIIQNHVSDSEKKFIHQHVRQLNRYTRFQRRGTQLLEEILAASSGEAFEVWWAVEGKPALNRLFVMQTLLKEWPTEVCPSYGELNEVVSRDESFLAQFGFQPPGIRQRYIKELIPQIDEMRAKSLIQLASSDASLKHRLQRKNRPESKSKRGPKKKEVALEVAKLYCHDEAQKHGAKTITVCREYLETHKIRGKPKYKPEQLSHLISSEFHQGRSKKYEQKRVDKN